MRIIITLLLILASSFTALSQSSWQRQEEIVKPPLQLFHSTEVFDLPTAETLQKGDYYFGISHKFTTPVTEGISELYGFDGSVIMRISLGYAITDDLLVKLGRSNHLGNIDLNLKYRILEIEHDIFPTVIAINTGIAYNAKAKPEPEDKSKMLQYFGHIIINTRIAEKLGIGIAPAMLINSNMYYPENINTFTLGAYIQYYFNKRWSIFAETTPTINGWRKDYDTYNLGLELNTGGHFFKVIFGNNVFTNTSTIMYGAPTKFESGDLHFGFMISRNL